MIQEQGVVDDCFEVLRGLQKASKKEPLPSEGADFSHLQCQSRDESMLMKNDQKNLEFV